MRKLVQLSFILLLYTVIGQNKAVVEKVLQSHRSQQTFEKFELFELNQTKTNSREYAKSAENVSVLNLNQQKLNELMAKKPRNLVLSIPYNGTEVTVELGKQSIITDD